MIQTVVNEQYGFRQLDPLPTQTELDKYYRNKYAGEKLIKLPEKMAADKNWLCQTVYQDILDELNDHGCKNILEVGCGVGDLGEFLKSNDIPHWTGVEPSEQAANVAINKGLPVNPLTLDTFAGHPVQAPLKEHFDAIIMLNVLEHVLNPDEFLDTAKKLMKPGGLLIVQVPNDFSPLQLATGKKLYWVVSPDHINYFNVTSLKKLLGDIGFDPYCIQSDYPMELFLFDGGDYIENPHKGHVLHTIRVHKEREYSKNGLRRSLYKTFAAAGLGRNILTFATKAVKKELL